MKDKKDLEIFIVNEVQTVAINQSKKEIELGNYILNETLNDEVINRYGTK